MINLKQVFSVAVLALFLTNAPNAYSAWSIDQNKNTIFLDNGYSVSLPANNSIVFAIKDAAGNMSQIEAGPVVLENDGGVWRFRANTRFELSDGTKITFVMQPGFNQSFFKKLYITKNAQSVEVTRLGTDSPTISDVGGDGYAIDEMLRTTAYIAKESNGVDDWTNVEGDKIARDMPFISYESYETAQFFTNLSPFAPFDPDTVANPRVALFQQFNNLVQILTQLTGDMQTYVNSMTSIQDRLFWINYRNALDMDLSLIRNNRNGTFDERVAFYNAIVHEIRLELKFNINLTSAFGVWPKDTLEHLEIELNKVAEDWTVFNAKLAHIRILNLKPGVGGGAIDGAIGIAAPADPADIDWSLIHEIGHYYDNSSENLMIEEFRKISGWIDVTRKFTDISNDENDRGEYVPFEGNAKLKRDGKFYDDLDPIDLDGDGQLDGIFQVHYGQVHIHDLYANEFYVFPGKSYSYMQANPIDDFADSFKLFHTNPSSFKAECPQKYAFMVKFAGYDPLAD